MSKSKKNEKNETATDHETAVAMWLDAKAKGEAALAHYMATAAPGTRSQDNKDGVKRRDAEIAHLEAKDAAALAFALASVAVDTFEVSQGDELAIARDPGHMLADLTIIEEDERRLSAELAEVQQRRVARVTVAQTAQAELAVRRSANGLPPPASVPQTLEALSARIEARIPPVKDNAARIRQLRHEQTNLLASLEREHREREEEKKRIADHDRRAAADRKEEAERASREHLKAQAKYEAEKAEKQALADAARARLGA